MTGGGRGLGSRDEFGQRKSGGGSSIAGGRDEFGERVQGQQQSGKGKDDRIQDRRWEMLVNPRSEKKTRQALCTGHEACSRFSSRVSTIIMWWRCGATSALSLDACACACDGVIPCSALDVFWGMCISSNMLKLDEEILMEEMLMVSWRMILMVSWRMPPPENMPLCFGLLYSCQKSDQAAIAPAPCVRTA